MAEDLDLLLVVFELLVLFVLLVLYPSLRMSMMWRKPELSYYLDLWCFCLLM